MAVGAPALAAVGAQAVPPSSAEATGAIEGTVYDSLITKAPLARATVYLVGTTFVAQSDSRGRFALDGVPAGEHTVTFAHPVLDSAGVQAPQVAVRVPAAGTTRVKVATPKGESLVKAMCPGPRGEQTGLLLGTVRDADTGAPLSGARVISRWFEMTIDKRGAHYETLQASAVGDDAGVFRLCGVPADIPVLVRATSGEQQSGRVEIYFSGSEVAFRDFTVSQRDTAARIVADSLLEKGSSDSVAVALPRGSAVVRGVVRDQSGRPLANVNVGLLDRPGTVATDADGRFTLGGVPAGTQTMEVRAIGFALARRVVALRSGAPTETVVSLDRAAQSLATVRVLGDRSSSRYSRTGFEDRMRRSMGWFMTGDEIERKSGIYLGDVLRYAPGLIPNYTRAGRAYKMRANWGGEHCTPTYYLDGVRWIPLDKDPILELERFISLRDVYGMEVYGGQAGTPAQFDVGSGCGAVVIWTKR